MADRGLTVGSTTSLHALAGDNIPREYHRKVLKKIAQLTKVVHNLHTKIDDHEEEMESQAAQHKVEISRLIDESSSRLKQWEEERTRVENLQIQLADIEKEKERLTNEHMSYTAEVEGRFHSIREQHLEKIKAISKCLTDVKLQLSKREKDCLDLQKKNDTMIAELKTADEIKKREIETLNQNYNEAARIHKQNMQLMKENHEQQIRDLQEAHVQELQSLKNTSEQAGILQNKVKESEEKYQTLELNFKTKETQLNQQLSSISVELSETKDRLAQTEQRGRDLERELSQKEKEFDSMRDSLKEKEIEMSNLQKQVSLFTDKASTAIERHQQQCIEMKQMAANLGELEALKTNYEHSIVDLQKKIQTLTEQVCQLEGEKKEALKSHQYSSEEALQKIQTLEKELEHQNQEKHRLRAQYAREIEAAHSKLTEKETSLEENYLRSIQQLREQHQQELNTLQKEMKENLDLLQAQLDSKKSSELSTLSEKHQTELASLSQTLSERTNELRKLQDNYDNLRSTLAEKERQLCSMTACVDELRQELATCKNDLKSLQKERDSFKAEATQLQLSLDVLKGKFSQTVSTHKEEMVKTEHTIQQQMEKHWTNKLRTELSSLRQELQQQYNEMNQAALNKTIDLKDKAFKEAEQEWEKDKNRLLQKIKQLEKEISDLHYSSEAALKQVNFEAQNELAELKQQLQREQEEAKVVVDELTKQKKQELEQLEQTLKEEKELLVQETVVSHQKELNEVHQANQLSITVLKDEIEKQNKKALTELQELHQKDLESLEEQLKQDHQLSLSTLQSQYNDKLQQSEVKSQEKITHLNTELSLNKTTVTELSQEIGDCRNLLMREKERVSQLTIELNTSKKHLQVKHEEVLATKREATIQIKLQEDQLSSAHRAELDSLHSQQRHQTQLLLNDFNKAKQLLTTKVQETEQRLFEAEQRYRNREPRPEDVEYIKELKRRLTEQEMKTKELIAEKKLYQLELMNREKNYNKLFNSSPHIGVLDPLHIKKKAKESTGGSTSTLRHSSDPSLFTPSSIDSLPSLNGSGSLLEPSTLSHRSHSPHKISSKGGGHYSYDDGELPGLVPSPVMSSHSPTTLNAGQRKLKFLSGNGQSDQQRKQQPDKKIGRLLESFPPSQSKIVHAVH